MNELDIASILISLIPPMWIVYVVTFFYVVWIGYLGMCSLKRAKDNGTISKPALVLAYPALILFVVADAAWNITAGSLIFVEVPREWLFTHRLSRLKKSEGWRAKVATFICSNLLDTFDPAGTHCK